jgi:hypothetical protein
MKLKWNGNLRRREAPLDNLQMTIIGDATRSQAQASGAARRSSAVTRGGFAAVCDRTRSDVRGRVARIPPGIVTGVRSTQRVASGSPSHSQPRGVSTIGWAKENRGPVAASSCDEDR